MAKHFIPMHFTPFISFGFPLLYECSIFKLTEFLVASLKCTAKLTKILEITNQKL